MMLQKSIILRHRSAGYIRFDMPAGFRQFSVAQALEQGVHKFRGVYRVGFSVRTAKLTIRFDDTATHFNAIALALHTLVNELTTPIQSNTAPPSLYNHEPGRSHATRVNSRLAGWAGNKVEALKETFTAMGVLLKKRLGKDSKIFNDPEKLAIEFFNDVIVLYLLKLHWHLITQHWLRKPIQYRYEWMAVLYLLYLLVRARQTAFRSLDEQRN